MMLIAAICFAARILLNLLGHGLSSLVLHIHHTPLHKALFGGYGTSEVVLYSRRTDLIEIPKYETSLMPIFYYQTCPFVSPRSKPTSPNLSLVLPQTATATVPVSSATTCRRQNAHSTVESAFAIWASGSMFMVRRIVIQSHRLSYVFSARVSHDCHRHILDEFGRPFLSYGYDTGRRHRRS